MNNQHILRTLCVILVAGRLLTPSQAQTARPADGSNSSPASAPQSVSDVPAQPSVNIPIVVCKGNELTITARNSTLASILAEVHKCTGAKIDIPAGAPDSQFFDTIGPGPIQEVLASLLSATSFNFVIDSSDSDPGKVESVILMARTEDSAVDAVAGGSLSPSRRAFQQMRRSFNTKGIPGQDESAASAEGSIEAGDNVSPSAPPEQVEPARNQTDPADQVPSLGPGETIPTPTENSAPPSPPEPTSSPAQPKNLEDQIMNMQQLFEQRRQMIANQDSSPH